MLALTYAIFSDALAPTLPSLPLTFAILPFVIWTALRFGQREVTALNALVCIIAVWHTIEGRGPFASAPLATSLLLLLAFIGTVVSTGLVLNAVVVAKAQIARDIGAHGVCIEHNGVQQRGKRVRQRGLAGTG